ncbi:MAG: hypothetical protein AMXMBFR34_09370 [Myxococcaceae bacterium]
MLSMTIGVLTLVSGATVEWGTAAFSTPVEVVRGLAAEPPGEEGTTSLLHAVRWSVGEDRRVRSVYRDVVRIQGADAVEDWSTIRLSYHPANDAVPGIRARIVTGDGRVFQLSPEMVHEVVVAEDQATVSDTRSVSAALPGVRSGAVIELEVTWQSTTPRFLPAQAGRFNASTRPDAQVDLVLEHPRSVPLKVSVTQLQFSRVEEDEGPLHRVRLRGTNVAAPEGGLGRVSWTTASSWQAVARGYLALLDKAREGRAQADVKALTAGATTRKEKAQRLLDWVHREVRYTGLEFGERSLVPWTPAEVVQRGFGDCKDMALLLVALLADAGVDARVALLDTEGLLDKDSPSLSFFDHAIVYLPPARNEGALWIDVTAKHLAAGLLPAHYAGELALVVDGASTGLVPTWAPKSTDSERLVDVDVKLPTWGAAKARVTQRLTGLLASWARSGIDKEGPRWLEVEFEDLGELIGTPPLTAVTQPTPGAAPMVYAGEAARAAEFFSDWSDAVLTPPEVVVGNWVPRALAGKTPPKLEAGRFSWPIPHVATLVFRVHPASGFVLTESPPAKKTLLGPAVLEASTQKLADGTVEFTLRFDSGPRDYTQAQVDEFRAAFFAWQKSPEAQLRFAWEGDVLRRQGKVRELLAWYGKRRGPGAADLGVEARYAGELLHLGLADAAREKSKALVEAHGDSALAWLTRGWVLSHDRFGNSLSEGFDRKGALAALRRALELESGCGYCREQLAWLERYDDEGGWLTARVDPRHALEAFEAAWPKDRSSKAWLEVVTFACDWKRLHEALTEPSTAEQRAAVLLADQMVDGAPAAWQRWGSRFDRDELEAATNSVIEMHLTRGRAREALAAAKAAGHADQVPMLERVAGVVKPPRRGPEQRVVVDLYAALLTGDEAARERFARTSVVGTPGGMTPEKWVKAAYTGAQYIATRTATPSSPEYKRWSCGWRARAARAAASR